MLKVYPIKTTKEILQNQTLVVSKLIKGSAESKIFFEGPKISGNLILPCRRVSIDQPVLFSYGFDEAPC
jgi:hypothetical protein